MNRPVNSDSTRAWGKSFVSSLKAGYLTFFRDNYLLEVDGARWIPRICHQDFDSRFTGLLPGGTLLTRLVLRFALFFTGVSRVLIRR